MPLAEKGTVPLATTASPFAGWTLIEVSWRAGTDMLLPPQLVSANEIAKDTISRASRCIGGKQERFEIERTE